MRVFKISFSGLNSDNFSQSPNDIYAFYISENFFNKIGGRNQAIGDSNKCNTFLYTLCLTLQKHLFISKDYLDHEVPFIDSCEKISENFYCIFVQYPTYTVVQTRIELSLIQPPSKVSISKIPIQDFHLNPQQNFEATKHLYNQNFFITLKNSYKIKTLTNQSSIFEESDALMYEKFKADAELKRKIDLQINAIEIQISSFEKQADEIVQLFVETKNNLLENPDLTELKKWKKLQKKIYLAIKDLEDNLHICKNKWESYRQNLLNASTASKGALVNKMHAYKFYLGQNLQLSAIQSTIEKLETNYPLATARRYNDFSSFLRIDSLAEMTITNDLRSTSLAQLDTIISAIRQAARYFFFKNNTLDILNKNLSYVDESLLNEEIQLENNVYNGSILSDINEKTHGIANLESEIFNIQTAALQIKNSLPSFKEELKRQETIRNMLSDLSTRISKQADVSRFESFLNLARDTLTEGSKFAVNTDELNAYTLSFESFLNLISEAKHAFALSCETDRNKKTLSTEILNFRRDDFEKTNTEISSYILNAAEMIPHLQNAISLVNQRIQDLGKAMTVQATELQRLTLEKQQQLIEAKNENLTVNKEVDEQLRFREIKKSLLNIQQWHKQLYSINFFCITTAYCGGEKVPNSTGTLLRVPLGIAQMIKTIASLDENNPVHVSNALENFKQIADKACKRTHTLALRSMATTLFYKAIREGNSVSAWATNNNEKVKSDLQLTIPNTTPSMQTP